ACPHALGLAIPLVVAISTSMGAQKGILVRNRLALEAAREIDTVIFDKTGTLTRGEPSVTDIITAGGFERNEVLRLAAVVEKHSEHPLGEAIVRAYQEKTPDPAEATDFNAVPGHGVSAVFNGRKVLLGNRKMMGDNGIDITAIEPEAVRLEHEGKTAMFVAADGQAAGIVAVADTLKTTSAQAVTELKRLGSRVLMITGDHSTPSTLKSHSWHELPVLLSAKNIRVDPVSEFGEIACMRGGLGHIRHIDIMPLAMAHADKLTKYGA
ncbi:MAG: HAD-IC family P-type ATPase, partial [Desulfomonilia bacterium]|nr:HAD-IC family P-type ATPase [Desulfomonilia bacterium]